MILTLGICWRNYRGFTGFLIVRNLTCCSLNIYQRGLPYLHSVAQLNPVLRLAKLQLSDVRGVPSELFLSATPPLPSFLCDYEFQASGFCKEQFPTSTSQELTVDARYPITAEAKATNFFRKTTIKHTTFFIFFDYSITSNQICLKLLFYLSLIDTN